VATELARTPNKWSGRSRSPRNRRRPWRTCSALSSPPMTCPRCGTGLTCWTSVRTPTSALAGTPPSASPPRPNLAGSGCSPGPGGHARSTGLRPAPHPTTWVAGAKEKQGSTGTLTIVAVHNEYAQDGRALIVDENDILHRAPGPSLATRAGPLHDTPRPAPREHALMLPADEALLFRFSALAYNDHRTTTTRTGSATRATATSS
jgi:hypothetical protein